jgi:hypothetical protein
MFIALLFSLCTAAHADLPAAWLEAPAHAPNIKMWIHRDSAEGKTPSTVTVQKHSTRDGKVSRLLSEAREQGWRDADLTPLECYFIRRPNLVSRQTWCVKGSEAWAFIELGVHRLDENKMQELIFTSLAGTP